MTCGFWRLRSSVEGCVPRKGHASGCPTLGMQDHPRNFALHASSHEPTLERVVLDCAASFQEQVS